MLVWLSCSPRELRVVASFHGKVKTKTLKISIFASLLGTQYSGIRVKTDWSRIGIKVNWYVFPRTCIPEIARSYSGSACRRSTNQGLFLPCIASQNESHEIFAAGLLTIFKQ